MLEIFFLLGFSLHNLEEAIWLPAWSKHASKFHPEVKKNEFHFAVIVVTAIGYLLTLLHFTDDKNNVFVQSIYYGFVLMMCLNVLFPHLIATIVLKRYAPGPRHRLVANPSIWYISHPKRSFSRGHAFLSYPLRFIDYDRHIATDQPAFQDRRENHRTVLGSPIFPASALTFH